MTRINVDDEYKKVLLSSEIRFYSSDFGGILIHHAWMGYKFSESSQIELGITKTPFGILPYASHNWFFNIHYYLGLEDDYDAGIKYVLNKEKFSLQAAFFKNSELPSRNYNRYSYDISDPQEEINQANLRLTYKLNSVEIGGSLQYGQLMNTVTKAIGDHNAGALHVNAKFNRLNILLQVISVDHNPIDSNTSVVRMSAYGASYSVASGGMVYSIGLQYKIPLEWGPFTELNFYNNFGIFDKAKSDFYDTYMNVLGASVAMGKMFTYIDLCRKAYIVMHLFFPQIYGPFRGVGKDADIKSLIHQGLTHNHGQSFR